MSGTVEFFGESYKLSGAVSEFALLEFAEAAADGQDGDTMQGMASIMKLLRECIAADDWGRFKAAARKNRATVVDHLMPVISAAFEEQAERPTGQPSDSSDGLVVTAPKSDPKPAGKVSVLPAGRPDIALALTRTG